MLCLPSADPDFDCNEKIRESDELHEREKKKENFFFQMANVSDFSLVAASQRVVLELNFCTSTTGMKINRLILANRLEHLGRFNSKREHTRL